MVHSLPLISALCQQNVDFVAIGGVAAIAQGSSYLTNDLDICYSREGANLARLAKALAPLNPQLRGAPANLPFVLDVATLRSGCNFTLKTSLGDIDILGEVPGLGNYTHVSQHAESLEIDGLPCQVLSLEGLILAKKAAGRPRDLMLLPELEALLALRKKQRGRD